ncbi:RNA polymerase sigma factor [Quadrisphaera sp. KR29]|uniref:RNA polymerase sigma factor n=1 Tax=Quadrisphaera sp. KR29 TaxID=3461391 RepID=UPI0040443060
MSPGRQRHLWSLTRPSRPAPEAPAGAAGDADRRERLTQLHEASYADLLRFVQRRVPGPEAEDVVASVFETAWVRLDEVPVELAEARPWLFGVARNVMANHHRAAVRRTGPAVRLAGSTAPDADVQAGDHDGVSARVDLVRAWRTLAAADQEVLSLVAFDGLRGEQAARVLGVSRSAFAMRLQRARQRLATSLHDGTADTAHRADGRSVAGGGSSFPCPDPSSGRPGRATRSLVTGRSASPTTPGSLQEMTWPST